MDLLAILPQQLVFGIVLGTVYGLIAIGYTMVYGVLFMINFAHGEVFMIGAYIGWGVLTGITASHIGGIHPAWVLPLMLAPAMIGCGALGVALERFAYRPLYLKGATRLGPLISAVGASIFLQNAVMLTQGARMKTYKTFTLFPRSWSFDVLGVRVSVLVLVMATVAGFMMWALNALVQRTSARPLDPGRGRGPRDGGHHGRRRLQGDRHHLLPGSALGGAAGVLVGLYYTQIDFVMGFSAGLKAFTAAVLGGIGNIKGAMVGGILLGVIESLAVTFLDPAYKDVVAFAVLILVLTFRPEGLFGEALADWKKV